MEVKPDSVQISSTSIALQIGNSTEFLDKSLGELFALVLVARDNAVTLQSLVQIKFMVEVDPGRTGWVKWIKTEYIVPRAFWIVLYVIRKKSAIS